jgi:hypothetical protein
LLLSQASQQAFAAHVLAKRPHSRPLFLSERHPILNPRQPELVNDTHIVKYTFVFLRFWSTNHSPPLPVVASRCAPFCGQPERFARLYHRPGIVYSSPTES